MNFIVGFWLPPEGFVESGGGLKNLERRGHDAISWVVYALGMEMVGEAIRD
jgi:hypothetical protein